MKFAGKRPRLFAGVAVHFALLSHTSKFTPLSFVLAFASSISLSSCDIHTRQASIFIPPTPHLRQFSATVFSESGLRATVIGSRAGLRAVPHHSHSEVPLVKLTSLSNLTSDCV